MIERALRDSVVVGVDVAGARGFEFWPRFEARLPDDLGNAAVESRNHAVGLRVTGRRQSMIDLQSGAMFVEPDWKRN